MKVLHNLTHKEGRACPSPYLCGSSSFWWVNQRAVSVIPGRGSAFFLPTQLRHVIPERLDSGRDFVVPE